MESISNVRTKKSTKENYQQVLSDLESIHVSFSFTLLTTEIAPGDTGPTILKHLNETIPSMSKHQPGR